MLNSILNFAVNLLIATVVVCTALEVLIQPALWPLAAATILALWLHISAWNFDLPLFLQPILTNKHKRNLHRSHV